jgi:hypothetical protein
VGWRWGQRHCSPGVGDAPGKGQHLDAFLYLSAWDEVARGPRAAAGNSSLTPFARLTHPAGMKSQRKQQRSINSISTGRWTAYAAAAAATGFAAAPSAEATIHYSGPINHQFKGERRFSFPLDPAGGTLYLLHRNVVRGSSSRHSAGSASFFVYAVASGNVAGLTTARNDVSVSNLNRGDAISARPFAPGRAGGFLAKNYLESTSFSGQFLERERNAFVGFKFNNGAGDQYGWARLNMMGFPFNYFTLVDYAYGDPGETVLAGQTESNGSAPVVLESLGGLALGATGLLAWRRRALVH